jgi:hypothetical protein
MANRLPTYQPVSVVANRGFGVGRLATTSPLDALVARLETVTEADPRPDDPLARLLVTRLDRLQEPLEVASTVLGETVWLVADDRQATTIRAKGGTPYTPPEVAILRELYAAVPPEVWAERLKLIHAAKQRFQGRLEP